MKLKYMTDFSRGVQKFLKTHHAFRKYVGLLSHEYDETLKENERLKATIKNEGQWITLDTSLKGLGK